MIQNHELENMFAKFSEASSEAPKRQRTRTDATALSDEETDFVDLLYTKFGAEIQHRARTLCGQYAEDASQSFWLKIMMQRTWLSFDSTKARAPSNGYIGWFRTVYNNFLIDYRRWMHREARVIVPLTETEEDRDW